MNTQKCYWCGEKRPPAKGAPKGAPAAKAKAKAKAQAKGGDATLLALQDEVKCLEKMMEKCPKSNGHLASAKAESERRLAEHIENKESDLPLCYTEVKNNRILRKEQAKLLRVDEILEGLEKRKEEIEAKIEAEAERKTALEDKIKGLEERAEKLKVPKAGQGWDAAVVHLVNAFEAFASCEPEAEDAVPPGHPKGGPGDAAEASQHRHTMKLHIEKAMEGAKAEAAKAKAAKAAAEADDDAAMEEAAFHANADANFASGAKAARQEGKGKKGKKGGGIAEHQSGEKRDCDEVHVDVKDSEEKIREALIANGYTQDEAERQAKALTLMGETLEEGSHLTVKRRRV